jgi:formylglycine-generating enzyme required for sulfatase activity
MVQVPAGEFLMGTEDADRWKSDGEDPIRRVTTRAFRIDAATVTAAQFQQFIQATGYVTDAERFGWSFVFRELVGPKQHPHDLDAVVPASWWLAVEGANWL